jgi:L-alanine-DL-glutamate epimerase-like enolase superfamily enzyme
MATGTGIEMVQAWACELPLPHPLSFGTYSVTSRPYTAVRVTTADGLAGEALGLSRGAPVDVAVIDVLAPLVAGRDALDVVARISDIERATLAMDRDGIMARARSLLEICLWDIRAQAAGWPLWRLLGGNPRPVPILLLEGYTLPDESDQAFAERLAARIDEGYRGLKIEAASYQDPRQLETRLASFRRIVGSEPLLVIDMAWSWRDVRQGIENIRRWSDYNITWVEDPLPRHRAADIARLRDAGLCPVAAGDEATRPAELTDLLRAGSVDVLRLDATTLGGIGPTLHLADEAVAAEARASLHVHPEVHQHCVFASSAFDYLEAYPPDRPFDCAHELFDRDFLASTQDGCVLPPASPGIGARLVDEVLDRTATRADRVKSSR